MPERNNGSRVRVLRSIRECYLVAAIVLASGGCAPAEAPPVRGRIDLKFEGVSKSDARSSEVTFILANGLDRAIYIRGDRTFSRAIRMLRPDADISCTVTDSASARTEVGIDFGFADRDTKFFEVSPNERVTVVIPTQPLQSYKSGRCYIKLISKEGTTVGPIEFQPETT